MAINEEEFAHRDPAEEYIRTPIPAGTGGARALGSADGVVRAQLELGTAAQTSVSPFRESLRRFARDRRAMASLILFGLILLTAFILPPIYEHIGPTLVRQHGFAHIGPAVYHGPEFLDDVNSDSGPTGLHWLGTDGQGRDLLARVLAGVKVSLIIAGIVVLVLDVMLGTLLGVLAGYFGGAVDAILARFTDLIFAFPGLLFAVLVTGIFAQAVDDKFGLPGTILLVAAVLGLTIWPQMARYVRGQTLQLKEQQYIEASRTIGTSSRQIITRHIIPNITSLIIVAATLDFAGTVVNEGVLSLLGLGVRPPNSDLGLMINESITNITTHPFEDLLPAAVLTVIVLTFSFIGDGARDAFDPRSKD